ncbi:NlpC/P60 family protein [Streptomyces sp. NEAU-H3]|uniref:C40 family peptidase n=1 Tax=Streptomyces sp. NEAU-H3 TaxID=2720636 RepID=UPI00280AC5B0|nr:NlpC/P60 family protein [Streptomyces sp. NEAU-H3]
MASHRRPKQPSRARVTVLTATAAAAVALTSQAAHADPKPTKSEVKSKVDKLYDEAEQATEKLNGATEKQKKLEKEVDAIQDKVARGQDELNEQRQSLGAVAAAQYRSGGIDPSVQLFLSADPDSFLQQAGALDQLSAQQTQQLKQIQAKQRKLAQERKEAADKLADLADTRKELGKKKSEVKAKLAEAQRILNSMTAAEKAAMQAEQDRANRASARTALTSAPGTVANPGKGSGMAGAAFSAAQSQLGKPYVFGATGPSSYDCSGLTSWAYRQAGVSLPRTSQAQANAGTRIYSQSQLQVGDLVLFYGDLHHIGLYAGNGQVLHAPRTGTVVRYESIGNMPFQFGVRV